MTDRPADPLRLRQWPRDPLTKERTLLSPAAIVRLVPGRADLVWEVSDTTTMEFDAVGAGRAELSRWRRGKTRVATTQLMSALEKDRDAQIVWGRLAAYRSADSEPHLEIVCVDGSYYELSGDFDVLAELRQSLAWAEGPFGLLPDD